MRNIGAIILIIALGVGAFLVGAFFGPSLGFGGLAVRGAPGYWGGFGMMGAGGHGMMGGGWFGLPFMLFGWLFQIGLIVLVVLGIVWAVRTLGRTGITRDADRPSQ